MELSGLDTSTQICSHNTADLWLSWKYYKNLQFKLPFLTWHFQNAKSSSLCFFLN